MGSHNLTILKREIIALSEARNWEAARREWRLDYIEFAEMGEPETCLCSHHPIMELCMLRNTVNDNATMVGNVCVKNFFGIASHTVFDSIKRITKDIEKSVSRDAIELFLDMGMITRWEYSFLLDTRLKRELSDRQLAKRVSINQKILNGIRRRGL